MTDKPPSRFPSAEDVKAAAAGGWREILSSLGGISVDLLDGKGHPCPKCGGTDRFSLIDEAAGAVLCRYCFGKRNGDGLAAIAWMHGCDFLEAIKKVADYLGLTAQGVVSASKPLPRSQYSQKSASSSSNGISGNNGSAYSQIVATYDYQDEEGQLLFQVVRYEPKTFKQRCPKPGRGWDWSVKGIRVVPYGLPQLAAEPNRPVAIVEGEKDVDNLARIGVVATCNVGGAGKWTAEHAEFLRGRHVVISADNDEPGRRHAQQVAQSLHGVAASVRIVELPGLPEKGDVSDWIAAGGTKEALQAIAKNTPIWTPTPPEEPWPDIDPFDTVDLPEFPTYVLPQTLRAWVEAESRATQTPPDLAAFLAIAVCASTIVRLVTVKPRPGWLEPINPYMAVLLDPGNRKSAVFADATRPLKDVEQELIEAARPEVARAQSRRRIKERTGKTLEAKATSAKGDHAAALKAQEIAAELAEQPEPVLPQLIVDDVTSEKLGMLLADQGGRIASMSPEGGVFDLMAGLYSKSGMPQFGVYLMAHSGDNLKTDRVSRKSVRVKQPALTCAYAMQPQVIEGVAKNAAFRGRGLLARFLYAAPTSWIGDREIGPPAVPDDVRQAYHQLVCSLAEHTEEYVLTLSPEADGLLRIWETEIERMLAEGGEMEKIRDWGAKLAGATLRLAAVLHCVEHGPTGCINRETLAAAIEIARYLVLHAEAVLEKMEATESSSNEDAKYVLRWINRHKLRRFTKRDVYQHGKRRFPKSDQLDAALAELAQRNYVRERTAPPKGKGRPPSPAYDVNPALFGNQQQELRSQNSHNSTEPIETGISENIGSASQHSEPSDRVRVVV